MKIYDRKKEQKNIDAFIKSMNKTKNNILMIYGASGIGKSFLSKHMVDNNEFAYQIRLALKITNNSIDDGFFLMKLAEQINVLSAYNPILSYENFVLKKIEQTGLKLRLAKIIDFIINIKTEFIKTIDDQSEFQIRSLSSTNLTDYYNYCVEVLNDDQRFAIAIEDMQSIDTTSYNYLLNLIKNSKNNLFILEYTDDNENNLLKYKENMRECNAFIEDIQLCTLPLEDQYKFLSDYTSREINNIKQMISKTNDNLQGNLRKLISLAEKIKSNDLDNMEGNASLQLLVNLEKQEKSFLLILHCNKEKLNVLKLNDIYNFMHASYIFSSSFDAVLNKLESKNIIDIDSNECVFLDHSTFAKVMDDKQFIAIKTVIASKLIDFYKKKIEDENYNIFSYFECFDNLMYLLINYQPNELLTHIEDLYMNCLSHVDVNSSIKALEKIDEHLNTNVLKKKELNKKLFDIYYNYGLFDKAKEKSDMIYQGEIVDDIIQAAIYNRLGENSIAIPKLLTLFNKKEKTLKQESVIIFLLSIAFASINDFNSCKLYNEILLKNLKYRSTKEYGLALRNSEIYEPLDIAIENNKKSIDFFNDRKDVQNQGKSYLTLSTLYALKGELEAAEESLNIADLYLKYTNMETHVIINNRICIRIQKKEFDNLIKDFELAFITVQTVYDWLVLYNNLFLYYIFNNEKEINIENLISKILLSIQKNEDIYLNRDIYYNLSKYYLNKDMIKANYYLDKCKDITKHPTWKEDELLWNFKLYNIPFENDNIKALAEFDYNLTYINYWHNELFYDELYQ